MRLLDAKSSPFSSRCRMVIYAKGLDKVELFEAPGGLFSDEYNALHPFVKVPLLQLDNGEALLESDVICEFLDDMEDTVPLKPAEPVLRARMRLLARIADLYIMGPMMGLFKHLQPEKRDINIVERDISAMMQGYDKLEYFLSGDPYAVGDRLSLADCTLVPSLLLTFHFLPRFEAPSPLDDRPKTREYWKRIQTDKFAGKVIAEINAKLAEYASKGSN